EYEALMADKRYEIISAMFPQMCERCTSRMTTSDMIDHVMTNKYLGIPIFLALMWGAFELTFSFANPFMLIIENIFSWLGENATGQLHPDWLASLVGEGIIGGVGSVFSFIPNIFILFFLLSMLEDSGYLARAAFIVDRIMYKIGLQGKSFIPMLLGFGCNVPAIMATRSIEDTMDRMATIMVLPFISCGARLPIYILFAGTFFSKDAGTVIFCIYILGIVVAIASAKLLRTTTLKGQPAPFILELPPYRVPTLKTSILHMWNNGSMYIKKAGTIILGGSIVIWTIAALPWGVEYGSEDSLIGVIGHAIQPFLEPLGFDWKLSVSLLFGFAAKEIVVASLGVLYGVGDDKFALTDSLLADPQVSPLTALSFMVFSLLYMPCMAAIGIIKKETGSWKWTVFSVLYGLVVAWLLAFTVFQGGKLLT
ncbi:MAG: ferrous iron transport protein B, partial [Methanomethylovorans sp.]|nr:ferrous iron transport protein B [Methanomethylovorans sp.]